MQCGIERARLAEMQCGIERARLAKVQCGIERARLAEMQCGIEPKHNTQYYYTTVTIDELTSYSL